MQANRWFAISAMLFCLLLLTSCARNASQAPQSLKGQAQPAQPNSSTMAADNAPTLQTQQESAKRVQSAVTTYGVG